MEPGVPEAMTLPSAACISADVSRMCPFIGRLPPAMPPSCTFSLKKQHDLPIRNADKGVVAEIGVARPVP
jgi:hypothetical protein